MSIKTTAILYWVLTGLLVLFSLFDAYGGLTHQAAGVKGVTHLGYPLYFLDMNGTAKLVGAICLFQTRYKLLKEWAYAGFVISVICAAWSHAAVSDPAINIIMPVIFLALFLLSYYMWKRYLILKGSN